MSRRNWGPIVLVTGGRDFHDWETLRFTLDTIHNKRSIGLLVQGGALGADRAAAYWADMMNVPYVTFPADWSRHGKEAGMLRNNTMLQFVSDMNDHMGTEVLVVAFPGGKGTRGMVSLARSGGFEVMEVKP